jgi:hypothetical protein
LLALAAVVPGLAAPPPLPTPLRLPPGLTQTLPIVKSASYLADAVRFQDCPDDKDNPFGVCSTNLFGGFGMWGSHLSGLVEIRFYPPRNNVAHFEVFHPGNLKGDDARMRAPLFYDMPVRENVILDAFEAVSQGDLNLVTGEVTNFKLVVFAANTWYVALGDVNPKLKPPPFTFPGIYGSAFVKFEQRPDGLLDYSFQGSTFLPLGNRIEGDPVKMPLPLCGGLAGADCAGFEAPGTSLHPQLRISTKAIAAPPCGARCSTIQPNSVQEFTANTFYSSFGDTFTVNIPALGGPATGRTHLQGRYMIQYGEPSVFGTFPVAVTTLPPSGLLAPIPDAPAPLSTFKITMLGHDERLFFPNFTYVTADPVLLEDGFDPAIGILDPTSGTVIGGLNYRGVPAQSLFSAIINLNITRIPLGTFRHIGPAVFERGPDGGNVFRFNGNEILTFDTLQFPSPDYDNPNRAFTAGPGSDLNPFMRFQGMQAVDQPTTVKAGSANNVLSSFDHRFNYSYSIPCDPVGRAFSFEYTNQAQSGTFRMENLAAVSCVNSRGSNRPRGDADIVQFTGYGTWSKDSDLHTANVQVSTAPGEEYVSIQIDGGLISKAHTKPRFDPIP